MFTTAGILIQDPAGIACGFTQWMARFGTPEKPLRPGSRRQNQRQLADELRTGIAQIPQATTMPGASRIAQPELDIQHRVTDCEHQSREKLQWPTPIRSGNYSLEYHCST